MAHVAETGKAAIFKGPKQVIPAPAPVASGNFFFHGKGHVGTGIHNRTPDSFQWGPAAVRSLGKLVFIVPFPMILPSPVDVWLPILSACRFQRLTNVRLPRQATIGQNAKEVVSPPLPVIVRASITLPVVLIPSHHVHGPSICDCGLKTTINGLDFAITEPVGPVILTALIQHWLVVQSKRQF